MLVKGTRTPIRILIPLQSRARKPTIPRKLLNSKRFIGTFQFVTELLCKEVHFISSEKELLTSEDVKNHCSSIWYTTIKAPMYGAKMWFITIWLRMPCSCAGFGIINIGEAFTPEATGHLLDQSGFNASGQLDGLQLYTFDSSTNGIELFLGIQSSALGSIPLAFLS
ncbi:hypothetical protein GY45DRAFT_1341597 [Cubamyces sp. BRFM 1775]|nr:hypothetical protein GY45DRAFT_1341597 [Cubamyces sp. BRFM 1775]